MGHSENRLPTDAFTNSISPTEAAIFAVIGKSANGLSPTTALSIPKP